MNVSREYELVKVALENWYRAPYEDILEVGRWDGDTGGHMIFHHLTLAR